MDIKRALVILDNAIKGKPNSCQSEHARGLKEVYELLFALDRVGEASAPEAAPPTPPPPVLKKYRVTVTLQDVFSAEDEREAWDMALDKISTRKGMNLCGDVVEELT